MKLTLGFSPCPNDTFIFDALIHHKIDTEGLEFEVYFDDVETLNQKAFNGVLDISKLSFHAFAYALDKYVLLDSGSALGFGVGPLLICNSEFSFEQSIISDQQSAFSRQPLATGFQQSAVSHRPSTIDYQLTKSANEKFENGSSNVENPGKNILNSKLLTLNPHPTTHNPQLTTLNSLKVGIPGKYTTANFLLSTAFPQLQNKQEMVFSEIEDALLNGEIDLGLIIHENRFTYQDKGLKKVLDLGEYWESRTGCAIPLGGIVVKRSLDEDIKQKVNRVLRRSVEYAFANPKSGLDFIRFHAQEMSEEVMYKHIDLYVNEYSVELGEEGRKAVKLLFNIAAENGAIPHSSEDIFLT